MLFLFRHMPPHAAAMPLLPLLMIRHADAPPLMPLFARFLRRYAAATLRAAEMLLLITIRRRQAIALPLPLMMLPP